MSLPAYARVDAAVYYRISEHVEIQLNVENLLDEDYFIYAHSNSNILPGSPTSARIAASVRF